MSFTIKLELQLKYSLFFRLFFLFYKKKKKKTKKKRRMKKKDKKDDSFILKKRGYNIIIFSIRRANPLSLSIRVAIFVDGKIIQNRDNI